MWIVSEAKRRSRRSWPKTIVLSLTLATAFAQKAPPPVKYDLQNESKVKGLVQELKLPPAESPKDNVHLLVKSGEDTLDVTLCPKSFLDDMGFTFAKGDAVSLTISKIKQEGAPEVILAREATKGEDRLILRDDKGTPAWNWKH